MVRIPSSMTKSMHDHDKPFTIACNMCKTCAYHTPLTPDEIEYASWHDDAHPCHERKNVICKGSHDLMNRIKEVK